VRIGKEGGSFSKNFPAIAMEMMKISKLLTVMRQADSVLHCTVQMKTLPIITRNHHQNGK
jgi:hypothetical protein